MSTKVYAHRGASAIAPENTMTAYKKAIEMGCHGIECDIQMSKDGKLVICHDETLDRTTNGKGFIKDYTIDELKELDAGQWFSSEFSGSKMPLLDELLELVKTKGVLLNIEMKNGVIIYPNIENALIDKINDYGLKEQTIISSFNHYSLYEIKKIDRTIKTGALYMCGIYEPWKYIEQLGCEYAHPFYLGLKPEIALGFKKSGYKINTFTVDDINIAKQLSALKIDGIITNHPDKILQAIS